MAHANINIGPLDPTSQTRLTVYAPDAGMGFTLEVDLDPNKMWMGRTKVCRQAATADCTGSFLDVLIWRFSPANPVAVAQGSPEGWVQDVAERSKQLGATAIKTYRKNIDKALPVAQVVGAVAGFLGMPHAPVVASTVSGLSTLNKAAESVEELHKWWTSAPLDRRIIRNESEALQVIEEWRDMKKPKNMMVGTAPGLVQQRVDELYDFIIRQGAKDLLPPTPF